MWFRAHVHRTSAGRQRQGRERQPQTTYICKIEQRPKFVRKVFHLSCCLPIQVGSRVVFVLVLCERMKVIALTLVQATIIWLMKWERQQRRWRQLMRRSNRVQLVRLIFNSTKSLHFNVMLVEVHWMSQMLSCCCSRSTSLSCRHLKKTENK